MQLQLKFAFISDILTKYFHFGTNSPENVLEINPEVKDEDAGCGITSQLSRF